MLSKLVEGNYTTFCLKESYFSEEDIKEIIESFVVINSRAIQ